MASQLLLSAKRLEKILLVSVQKGHFDTFQVWL